LSLVLVAITGGSPGDNFALLGKKPNQPLFIPEVNVNITSLAKAADSFLPL
jgi:hypothetical protein